MRPWLSPLLLSIACSSGQDSEGPSTDAGARRAGPSATAEGRHGEAGVTDMPDASPAQASDSDDEIPAVGTPSLAFDASAPSARPAADASLAPSPLPDAGHDSGAPVDAGPDPVPVELLDASMPDGPSDAAPLADPDGAAVVLEPDAGPRSPDDSGAPALGVPVAGNRCVAGASYGSPVPSNPQPEKLADVIDFSEGPVWFEPDAVGSAGQGVLFFTDFTGSADDGRIRSYDPDTGDLGILIDEIGVNGLAVDGRGGLLGASHELRGVIAIDPVTHSETLLPGSDSYQDAPLNSVNDLVARVDGHIYFTDPTYQRGSRPGQPVRGYYHLSPLGELTQIGSQNQPNGIALSPQGLWLYVAGTGTPHELVRHRVNTDGSVDVTAEPLSDLASDGMAIDCAGNLYLTTGGSTNGTITILSPLGELLGVISGFSGGTTNAAFGGPTRTTLFVTTSDALWQVELPVPGLPN